MKEIKSKEGRRRGRRKEERGKKDDWLWSQL